MLKNKIVHNIDGWLWRHGFRFEKIRLIVRILFLLNLFFLLSALVCLPFSLTPLSFALASLLTSINFYSLARYISLNFPLGGARKLTLHSLFMWFIRMFIVFAVSYLAIVVLALPLFPWLLGLGLPLFTMPFAVLQGK